MIYDKVILYVDEWRASFDSIVPNLVNYALVISYLQQCPYWNSCKLLV